MSLRRSTHDLEGRLPQPRIDTSYESDKTANALTNDQLYFLFVSQPLGNAFVDATINFAMACAMYRTTHKEIRIWPLEKNTIAGDLGVTIIIQGLLSTTICTALIRQDVRNGKIAPFPFIWPRRPREGESKWKRRWRTALCFLSPTQTLSFSAGQRVFWESLCLVLIRGFILCVLYFFLLWPISIAIIAPLYGGINMHGSWTPEIIKTIFGFVYGLTMAPLVAALVLGAPPPVEPQTPKRKIATTTPISPRLMRQADTELQTIPLDGPRL